MVCLKRKRGCRHISSGSMYVKNVFSRRFGACKLFFCVFREGMRLELQ